MIPTFSIYFLLLSEYLSGSGKGVIKLLRDVTLTPGIRDKCPKSKYPI
jgi:hypothetical protein